MILTNTNYHGLEANSEYWSLSLFKAFDRCEAAGLASVRGEYEREETDALLIGSYVDAYFSETLDEFIKVSGDRMYKRDGTLYAKFEHANDMIDAVEAQPLMMEYLKGDKQVIMTADLFGVSWKIKMDVYQPGKRIVDFKTVKDFKPIYKDGFGYMDWVSYWGYDIQGAIYQKVVELNTGEKLPFYLNAVTKEAVPDKDVIQIPQHVLDTALKIVEAKIDRYDLVKMGEIEPDRCEKCEYCKQTKRLTAPSVFEPEEV